jgi:hypothetical protein
MKQKEDCPDANHELQRTRPQDFPYLDSHSERIPRSLLRGLLIPKFANYWVLTWVYIRLYSRSQSWCFGVSKRL